MFKVILYSICFCSFLLAESVTTKESDKSSILLQADKLIEEERYIDALEVLNQPFIISNLQISPMNQLWLTSFKDYIDEELSLDLLALLYTRIGIAEKISEYLSVSESLINKCLKIDPDNSEAFYYLAIIYSRRENIEKSLYYLEKAFELDYIDYSWFMADDALEDIRKTSGFQLLVDEYFTENDIIANENYNKGDQYFSYGDYNNAAKYLNKAAKLWKTSDKYWLLADIHGLISFSYKELGKNKKFFKEMKKVLEYYEKDGDMEQVAETYSYLGFCYWTLNDDYKKSISNYNSSLELYQELQDTVKIAEQYSEMFYRASMHGYDTDNDKYFQEAIDYSKKAGGIYVLVKDSLHFAEEAEKIGYTYDLNLSNYTEAIEYLSASYTIYSELGVEDKALEVKNKLATALRYQGEKYSNENKFPECVEYLEYSLDYNPNLEDLKTRALTLFALSMCYLRTGEIDKSLLLSKEIEELANTNNFHQLIIVNPIAIALPLSMMGKREEAMEMINNAIESLSNYPNKDEDDYQNGVYALNGIATLISINVTKNIDVAMPYMQICFSVAEKHHLEDALYYYLKAIYYMYVESDIKKSLKYIKKSVKDPSLKGIWSGLSPFITNELAIMYYINGMFDKAREKLIEVYNYNKINNDFSGTATTLLYLSIINMMDMISNDSKELAENTEIILHELITLLDENLSKDQNYSKEVFDQYLLSYEWYAMVLNGNGKGIQALGILDDVRSRNLTHKLFLKEFTTLDELDEYSKYKLLDDDIVISLDIINNASHPMYQYDLAKQSESEISNNIGIEFNTDGYDLLVQSFFTHDDSIFWDFKNRDNKLFSEAMPNLDVIVKIYNTYLQNKDLRARELGKSIYEYLFNYDGKYIIKGKKHLIIIPDPVLSYLPFETLIDEDGKYLIETYDIAYIQSHAIYSVIQGRDTIKNSKLLAFGGISYKNNTDSTMIDPNIATIELEKMVASIMQTRGSLTDIYFYMGFSETPYLPFTLSEVQDIKKIIPGSLIKTGTEASENNLKEMSKSGKLAEYNVLHFATHGFIVPEIPDLSALVLAADDKEDGYLNASEIMNLDLKADLVNLSACETGLGKIYKGEGVVGLTQAFMIAGANAVSVTLWPVADESTSIFMTAMYKTAEEMDISYLESMSIIKRKFISGDFGEKYKDPYYWAPFVYYGE